MNRTTHALAALLLCLPATALAAPPGDDAGTAISRGIADSRAEVRAEMAAARAGLDREDLALGGALAVGRRSRATPADTPPPAHISRDGDLVVDGSVVAITPGQRRLLLDYRQQVLALARAGIDAGEQAAMVALDATDISLFGLVMGGVTGRLEQRIEKKVEQEIRPMVARLCRQLPAVRAAQQALAARLPAFQPYADLDQDDLRRCDDDVRHGIASRPAAPHRGLPR
ncbi:YggN family protein [Stenotrophomonas mori]|uniref:YggN family protein n=1 Tax=Stenotrophomonas mori TaxID=2871096 RepID=A0ABT0SE75_9GAMM|nr:YggN family protein [Stenotrophomonas mori]MCL7713607.1 YggN family protein [Stenotrophomonas mori]